VVSGDGRPRKKVSVIGAVSVSPVAQHPGLDFAALPDGFFTAAAVVGFRRDLREHLRGNGMGVWGGGGNPKGPLVRASLRRNRRRALERLPASAPDLSPAEAVWSWLKYGQRANYVPDGVPALAQEVVDRLIGLKSDPDLLRRLWGGSDLPFPLKEQVKQGSLPASQ
jgi:hypothetical protein